MKLEIVVNLLLVVGRGPNHGKGQMKEDVFPVQLYIPSLHTLHCLKCFIDLLPFQCFLLTYESISFT